MRKFSKVLDIPAEDIAPSTASAASGTSATLEMKIVHLLASDRLTTSLKVQKFIRLLTVERCLSCLNYLLHQENNPGNLQTIMWDRLET